MMLDIWVGDIAIPIDASLLDEGEAREVARYRFEDDRKRAAMGRYMRRVLLAKYLSTDPRSLRFTHGEEGKPALLDGGLEFNISHSGQRVVLAVAHEPVGVDIEAPRTVSDARAIAKRFFAPEERRTLETADDVQASFLAIWTAKEAVVKTIGRGLSQALDSFVVHPEVGRFVPVESELALLQGLRVHAFELGGGLQGAVAIRCEPDVSINWLGERDFPSTRGSSPSPDGRCPSS